MAALVTFSSKAATSILMFADVAEKLMVLMGKRVSAQGIVTVAELPAAIAGLQAAMNAERSAHVQLLASLDDMEMANAADTASDALKTSAFDRPVSLVQRAAPLLDMLMRAETRQVPVVWGV